MFVWFKVLRNLSKQENYLEKNENRLKSLAEQLDSLEQIKAELVSFKETMLQDIKELESRHQSNKLEFEKLKGQIDNHAKDVKGHLEAIKEQAQQHCASLNKTVEVYEGKISALSQKITTLGNTITEFQR